MKVGARGSALGGLFAESTAWASDEVGIHGRLAVLFGERPSTTSGRRIGPTIGGDIHTTFFDGGVIALFTAGVGLELY